MQLVVMDDASVNFIELVALTRITPDSTVERFGSLINSSFFDASNIVATMKLKGLVDFVTAFPNQSSLKIAEGGTKLLGEANQKAMEPLDALDMAIMVQLSNGRRGLADLNGSVNVTQKDLALHLFKLNAQQQISYELANSNLNVYLTEKGFITVKSAAPQPGTAGAQSTEPMLQQNQSNGGTMPQAGVHMGDNISQPQAVMAPKTPEEENKVIGELIKRSQARKRRKLIIIGGVVILVLIIALVVLTRH